MPIQLRLLLWFYNRFLKVDLKNNSVDKIRSAIYASGDQSKKLLNGPVIPIHKIEDRRIPVREGHINIRIYQPNDQANLPVIVYYHGGGFVLYGLDSHDHICRRVCRDNLAIVVSVDYRLAPEFKFPTPVHDSYDAFCWVAEHIAELKGDPGKLIVMGDSAGGNLATVVSHIARDAGGPKIAAQLLVYPVVDARMGHPSIKSNGKGYILTEELMRWFLDHYKSKEEDVLHPQMSPLLAEDLSNLPPALVQVADLDPLRDEGLAYAKQLKENGNEVQLTNYTGLVHSFFSMPGLCSRCTDAYTEIQEYLAVRLAK